jgi:hypothetical protein
MTLTIPQPRTPAAGEPPRWDALDMPEEAGRAVLLRDGTHHGPALVAAGRMLLLVPEGSAEELPGLLEWLEWSEVELDLTAHSGCLPACLPVCPPPSAVRRTPHGGSAPRGADQWWVRPPGNGSSATPAGTDLVRLVSVVATECHRVRLVRAAHGGGPHGHAPQESDPRGEDPQGRDPHQQSRTPRSRAPQDRAPLSQADAFSYASRMFAGTLPRSFTS